MDKQQKSIRTIYILAAISPLLGLLGTVTGIIETFTVLSTHNSVQIKNLSAGISEALLTTQSGLIVAIPGMIAAAILTRQIDKIRDSLEIYLHSLERDICK